jgi:hypothetical protein
MAPRILLCCLAVLALAGCGAESAQDGGKPAPETQLTIRVDPDGDGPEPAEQARIACPGEDAACAAAEQLRPADFEPAADDVACTQQFGGPQTATVSGSLAGEPVDARFSRQDGCAIARWEKVAPLLEAAGR